MDNLFTTPWIFHLLLGFGFFALILISIYKIISRRSQEKEASKIDLIHDNSNVFSITDAQNIKLRKIIVNFLEAENALSNSDIITYHAKKNEAIRASKSVVGSSAVE